MAALILRAAFRAARGALPQPDPPPLPSPAGGQTITFTATTGVPRRNRTRSATLCALAAAALPLGAGQKVTLEWEPSVDATVTGYRLYHRDLDSADPRIADAGNTTLFSLTNLTEAATYIFYVTAYNSAGLESDPSNNIEYTVPLGGLASVLTKDALGNPIMKFHIEPVAGLRVGLQSSTNLVDWTLLRASAPGLPLSVLTTNVPGGPSQFYRSICLPGGDTPGPIYAGIIEAVRREEVSFAEARMFLLDEYGGLPPEDPGRRLLQLRQGLMEQIDPPLLRFLNPDAPNLAEVCRDYEAAIGEGFDLVLLEVGRDGQLGLNGPGSAPDSPTRRVEIPPASGF